SSLSSPNAPAQSILSLSSDTATTEIYTLSLHDALPISRGISVTDVNKLAEQDSTLDRELDARQRELASAGDCVVESRLAGWMVDADLKIWLRAAVDVRAARVARREGQPLESARAELLERERSEWARYKRLYNIDTNDLSPYHVIIDTSYWNAEAIADTLAGLVRSMLSEHRAQVTAKK